jgi:hypothetical protein
MPYKICTISQDNYQKINCDLFIDDVNCGEYGYGQIRLYATDQNGQIDVQRQSILRTLLNDEIYFGDMITKRGVGNGITVIILAGILSDLFGNFRAVYQTIASKFVQTEYKLVN